MLSSRHLLRRTCLTAARRNLCTAESATGAFVAPTPLYSATPRIVVVGCGGAGGNAVNNMISRGLEGVDFVVCNTDAQHLGTCLTDNRVQMGSDITSGLGCGANPEIGKMAAEASIPQIMDIVGDADMVFVTAGMGGGTGTGAAPVIAQAALDSGMLTVAVVTEPFRFEGKHRAQLATDGLLTLKEHCNTMIVIPNDNLFKLLQDRPDTSLMEAFRIADDVLLAGVKSITDLMVIPGLINLDFADVQSIMGDGKIGQLAMMGTGQASGDGRAAAAAEGALSNPLLGDLSVEDGTGMLINITGGSDMTLFEVDEAAQFITNRLRDPDANIIFGSAFDDALDGSLKVSMVATLPTAINEL